MVELLNRLNPKQEMTARVSSILRRAYGSLVRISEINSDKEKGIVWGKFWGTGNKLCVFVLDLGDNSLRYSLLEEEEDRTDSTQYRKAFKCVKGIPCKGVCIPKGYECKPDMGKIASRQEMEQIKDLQKDVSSIPYTPESKSKYYRSGKPLPIRELKELARERRINNYSNLTSGELISAMEAMDATPRAREAVSSTVVRRRNERRALLKAASLADPNIAVGWKRFNQFSNLIKDNPELFAPLLIAGTVAAGKQAYDFSKGQYAERVPSHAATATKIAERLDIKPIEKPGIIFAVGEGGTQKNADRIKELMKPADDSDEEQWFEKKNEVIAVGRDLIKTEGSAVEGTKGEEGVGTRFNDTVSYAKQVAGTGTANNSINLAAHFFAYGNEYPDKKISVVAHGNSGVDEAIDILSRIKPQSATGLSGREIAERINLVRLGSSNLGFTDDNKVWRSVNHRTVTSTSDPFSIFPKKNGIYVNQATGGSAEDYLKTPEVRSELRAAFDYYSGSNLGNKKKRELALRKNREATGGSDSSGVFGSARSRQAFDAAIALDNRREAGAIVGADFAEIPIEEYQRRQRQLAKEVERAASEAQKRHRDLEASIVQGNKNKRRNALIVVGGTLQPAGDMINNLPEDLKRGKALINTEDYNIQEFSDLEGQSLKPDTVAYYRYLAKNGYGKQIRSNLGVEGKYVDEGAIQLAAVLYGHYYQAKPSVGGTPSVAIVAAGDGAIKTRMALAILAKMNGSYGEQAAKNIKLVSLGCPDFSLIAPNPNETKIMASGDLFRLASSGANLTIPGNHAASSYLQNTDAIATIKKLFAPPPRPRRKK